MSKKRVAAIDFGTNTARLLIADRYSDGSFDNVRIEREIVRMGGGFSDKEGLSADAIQRGIRCLGHFANIIADYGVSTKRAVATSAIRDAVNGCNFVELIYRQTGIALTVIDGIQEGGLTLAGVLSGLDCQHDDLLVFDVGGGSTEYTLTNAGKTVFIKSLPLGVVRLTEGGSSSSDMSTKINKELDLLFYEMAQLKIAVPDERTMLIGTAGTATTMAAISMKMKTYDYRKVHNSTLSINDIRRIYSLLLPLSLEERLTVPGLEKGREDLIIAGILITLNTMERFGFTTLKISDYSLLEGLIVSDEY